MLGARALTGLCVLAMLAACGSTSIYVPVVRPYEINLEKVRSAGTAVYFSYRSDEHASPLTAHELTREFAATLSAANRFNAFSLYEFDGMVRSSINESILTVQHIRELASETNAEAFIVCELVRFRYEEDILSADVNRYYKSDGKQLVRKGLIDAQIRCRVVDAASQTMLWDDTLAILQRAETSAADKEPPPIDAAALAAEAIRSAARELLELSKQVTESVLVTFLDDGEYPEIAKAVTYARKGEWSAAVTLFETVAGRAKGGTSEHKMLYNLGIAHQYSGNYRSALECFDKALQLKDSQRYKIAREDCLAMERSYLELMNQQ